MRILIICEDRVLAEGLSCLIEEGVDLEVQVAGSAWSSSDGLRLARETKPEVALVTLRLQDSNGVDTTRCLREDLDVRVLVLVGDPASEPVAEALEAGALGCITRDVDADELVRALRSMESGTAYLSPEVAECLRKSSSSVEGGGPVFTELSVREREVLRLLTDGRGTKEVAAALGISSKTVDTHRKHIMEKLEVDNLAQLTKYAIRAGLTSLDS